MMTEIDKKVNDWWQEGYSDDNADKDDDGHFLFENDECWQHQHVLRYLTLVQRDTVQVCRFVEICFVIFIVMKI